MPGVVRSRTSRSFTWVLAERNPFELARIASFYFDYLIDVEPSPIPQNVESGTTCEFPFPGNVFLSQGSVKH
jgi:hypothetical protein